MSNNRLEKVGLVWWQIFPLNTILFVQQRQTTIWKLTTAYCNFSFQFWISVLGAEARVNINWWALCVVNLRGFGWVKILHNKYKTYRFYQRQNDYLETFLPHLKNWLVFFKGKVININLCMRCSFLSSWNTVDLTRIGGVINCWHKEKFLPLVIKDLSLLRKKTVLVYFYTRTFLRGGGVFFKSTGWSQNII